MRKLKFIDLFAGIGGFRLGMEQAGHICVGHCEIDKFANKSYIAMHSPKEDEWYADDITRVKADDIPKCDCWCFGFPCQDISVAGKQQGFSGQRSSLFFTVTGLIRGRKEENKPSYLLIENVKNLLSINRGRDFARILMELDEIGYDAEWCVLNTADVLPQNRERVFIIGHLRGRRTRKVFPIVGKNTKINPKIKIIGSTKPDTCTRIGTHDIVYDANYTIGCLMSSDYKQPKQIAIPILTPNRLTKRQNGRRIKTDGEPMFTLTSQDRHGVLVGMIDRVWGKSKKLKIKHRITVLKPESTKGTAAVKFSAIHSDKIYYYIRKLTPREYFRLQGFPDAYFDRAQAVNSDSQLYKQAGNSVTVPVIYELAKRMEVYT